MNNNNNNKYYEILDLLDDINALEKVIKAHEKSPSEYSKNQYVKLKIKRIEELKAILEKENINFDKLFSLSGEQSPHYYQPIYQ